MRRLGAGGWRGAAMICGVAACGPSAQRAERPPAAASIAAVGSCSAEALPNAAAVSDVAITCRKPSGEAMSTKAEAVAAIFERPVAIPCDRSDGWSYAPWCSGTIVVDGRQRELTLYLGGRGRLASAAGDILFSFDPAAFVARSAPAAPAED